jgi:hypothetical protein
MAEFNFSNVKVAKSEKVPALKRTRTSAPNPLVGIYAESVKATGADGHGAWMNMVLPGKAETVVTEVNGKKTEKTVYGPTVKKAMNLLRQAAAAEDKGVSFRATDDGKGNITLHFQSKPKRGDAS